jgi:hypothetical protein
MKTNSFAFASGGMCGPNRIKGTARAFAAAKGTDSLVAFLRATAGVSNVADVPERDRFRINGAMRAELHLSDAATPQHQKELARIGAKAFARMVQR